MSLHKEITFETEICQHLAAIGWLKELCFNLGHDPHCC